MVQVKCPKCGSLEVDVEGYMGTDCVICKDCGYDECAELEVYPEGKTSKDKPVYRTGGPKGKR
ncbi:MAG: hypothetical protein ACE5FT_07505 [Candidatus Nanoarchaeia archaeon]